MHPVVPIAAVNGPSVGCGTRVGMGGKMGKGQLVDTTAIEF